MATVKTYSEALALATYLESAEFQAASEQDEDYSESLPVPLDVGSGASSVKGEQDQDCDEDLAIPVRAYTTDPACIAPDFSINKYIVGANEALTFTDLSTGVPDAWLWTFGDGHTSTDQNPTHAYDTPGIYDVTLFASRTDALSYTEQTIQKVGILCVMPDPDFIATPESGEPKTLVQFTNETSHVADSYLWDFGDGAQSTDEDPEHTFVYPGYYTISLTVFKEFGGTVYQLTETKDAFIYIAFGAGSLMNQYLDDISFRIRNPRGDRWQYYPHIQRTLDRLYHRLCKDYRLVQDYEEMDFSTLDPFVHYWTLPRWFMKLYKLDPNFEWREPDEFDSTEADTYTIDGGKIHFGGIDETSVITMYFYSSGKPFTTKATAQLEEGEINEPEWTDRSLDQALYYGACIELSDKYPGRDHDIREFERMRARMADSFDSQQDKDQTLPGDPPGETPIDAFDY